MVSFIKEIMRDEAESPNELAVNSLLREYSFKIRINRLRRARRITLRVCQVTGELRVTTPLKVELGAVKDFINRNLDWIMTQIKAVSPLIPISEGTFLPIFGKERALLVEGSFKNKYCLSDGILKVKSDDLVFSQSIKRALTQIAEEFFIKSCNEYAQKIEVSFSKISIRDPKSRWGSCSSEKKMMFSWRLVMAPKDISSYVAAHEVAHLIHMNHSKEFWKVVNYLCPSYLNHRTWLRNNGRKLHKFVF